MGFRTLEIRHPAELHVATGQLSIEQETGKAVIPLEDLTTIVCIGADIRLSTLGMAQMARNGITVTAYLSYINECVGDKASNHACLRKKTGCFYTRERFR